MTETIRVSGGPRLSMASADFFDTYFGVDAEESTASGLSEYDPGGGLNIGRRRRRDHLEGDRPGHRQPVRRICAACSGLPPILRWSTERGSKDQFMLGLSTTYRFDFTVP